MPRKTHEHVNGTTPHVDPAIMRNLAATGIRMYHPPHNRFIESYRERLGTISLTDGVYIPREAPEEPNRDLAEVMEVIDNQVEPTSGVGWPE